MKERFPDRDPWTSWWQGTTALAVLIALLAVVFPRQVYDGFIWRYLWGPIVADGRGAACAQRIDGEVILLETAMECQTATGVVAEPGYTTVSTLTYAAVLLVFLAGLYLGVERFDVPATHALFFALVPFMFLGGAVRVLEDATLLVPADAGALAIDFPLRALIIAPLIYFLVFALATLVIAAGLALDRRGHVERFEYVVAGAGTVLLIGTLAYLVYLSSLLPGGSTSVAMFIATLGGATVVTGVVWAVVRVVVPSIDAGTGAIGPLIVWGHAVDAFANVLSLDWADELGLAMSYDPKHVINQAVIDVTSTLQPAALSDAIGTVWPFIPLKVLVATAVVWMVNDELMEDSPRFGLLLLVAVLAVGLGPGTRDLLRATLGV